MCRTPDLTQDWAQLSSFTVYGGAHLDAGEPSGAHHTSLQGFPVHGESSFKRRLAVQTTPSVPSNFGFQV
jgi:hypothetical protein